MKGLTTAELGSVISAALIGGMVGYFAISPLAERFGHRRVLLVATTAFAILTFASAFAGSVTTLLVLRFLAGIGLGAIPPSAIALTSEFAPKRVRATFVLVIYCGFSFGFVVAGLVAGPVIPIWDGTRCS